MTSFLVNFIVCAEVECPPNHAPKTERDEAQKGCVDNGGQFPRAQDKVTHTSCGNEQYYLCERGKVSFNCSAHKSIIF